MGRDITKLHPTLQKKVNRLITLCKKQGINIKIGECLRTVAEQDALYAKGRTKPGPKVTNAKGSSYSSMHQWGVGVDFFLDMDVDGDGSKSDDAYNNSTKLFNKVGKIGKSVGLEWGGNWTSITDLPHFQLPNWGSTTSKLKSMYGTPDKFMKTWGTQPVSASTTREEKKTTTTSKSSGVVVPAQGKDLSYSKTYKTTANLNLRASAGEGCIITTIPKGSSVTCYGYYTKVKDTVWYFVAYGKYTGYVSSNYCK